MPPVFMVGVTGFEPARALPGRIVAQRACACSAHCAPCFAGYRGVKTPHRGVFACSPLVPNRFGNKEAAGRLLRFGIKTGAPKGAPCFYGRSDRIRTCGLLVPNQAHYQAVPHPDLRFQTQKSFYHSENDLSSGFCKKTQLVLFFGTKCAENREKH